MGGLTPVHFLSHGTPMLLAKRSSASDYFQKIGQEAQRHGIEGVIMMGAHWDVAGSGVRVATKPDPTIQPLPLVKKSLFANYKPNVDVATAKRCVKMLQKAGIEAEEDPTFDWLIDCYPILLGMFPEGCPPTVIVSQNRYFDPYLHMRIGAALRPLRREGYLCIGSGGGIHNLYLAEWTYTIRYKDNFIQDAPPDEGCLEFRQALKDVICKNGGGPALRRGILRLFKHPSYRRAHGTDDHFMPACFAAGLAGDVEDEGTEATLGAEVWELRNIDEMQFTIGSWSTDCKEIETS